RRHERTGHEGLEETENAGHSKRLSLVGEVPVVETDVTVEVMQADARLSGEGERFTLATFAFNLRMIHDIAYGLRLLRKSPSFAVTCIVIVALGIGATTAIFSVIYGVTLRPLPYRDPDRLVSLWTRTPKLNLGRVQVNAADHRDWLARNHVFGEIALVRALANFNLTGYGEPERLFGARVSASMFRVMGVAPAIGRAFVDEENEIGRDS